MFKKINTLEISFVLLFFLVLLLGELNVLLELLTEISILRFKHSALP